MRTISAPALSEWLLQQHDAEHPRPQLLDVREAWEFQAGHLSGSTHVPLGNLPRHLGEISLDGPVVCICHHGARSAQAAMFLESRGVSNVFNLTGGVEAWSLLVDPAFPRY